ncbi:beta-ketoacyl-[acyl-carrier-protein] synthase family protein [Actinoalloteichus hymeniacidonis]|uniref:3-oxoacyl-(Acyl-carrier-protein) synthase n=1 Tax=Actinoalloteichus hymeniacidonis TaxID=340345 RepID=A0AAC9HN00_9PSEU|nr:beta-ketoacyl-[acyl-carrier-protein] synthase family protein [Actinoalloteichus hymeniacidonis]AOS62167.1 3-oxoacyl-(acyl-carrier-protein) synthase [Actinoalloteichus hymeniacidonis]MBB5909810.1 3-oxoacyl-[acyl-carrier-protein] synthase II [Actinoalloteichus hymeniacidonis]
MAADRAAAGLAGDEAADSDVVVTGMGVFTAFGYGTEALLANVFEGRQAFSSVRRFDVAGFRSRYAATYPAEGIRDVDPQWSAGTPAQRAVLLDCARQAMGEAGLDGAQDVALSIGTAGDDAAHVAFWEQARRQAQPATTDQPSTAQPATTQPASVGPDAQASDAFADCVPAYLAESLAETLRLRGPARAFVNACVASTNAIVHGAALIRSGRARLALCGGASLVGPHAFRNFDAARALTRQNGMRPFSSGRSGLLLGDGAAMLVLESAGSARRRGVPVLGRILGWGMSADAHHLVRPDPAGIGVANAISAALRSAGEEPAAVDYVNAHGTATLSNDVAETAALHRVFGPDARRLAVSSTKGSTGHLLEATGAVELVVSLLALREGLVPPTVGYGDRDPACDLDYVPGRPRRVELRRVLTLNSAVGGLNAAILAGRA